MLGNEDAVEAPGAADVSEHSGDASEAPEDVAKDDAGFTQTDIFKHMRLRKIVRENHSERVAYLELNRVDDNSENMLLAVGANAANVYDNEHVGDHLDIVSSFTNDNVPEEEALCAGAWVPSKGDSVFAVGGAEGSLHACSLARSEQRCELTGHKSAIIAVAANPARCGHVLSLSKDVAILWDVNRVGTDRSLARVAVADASAVAFDLAGNTLAVGTTKGHVHLFSVDAMIEAGSLSKEPLKVADAAASHKLHTGTVDFIKFTSAGYTVSKNAATFVLWDAEGKVIRKVLAKAVAEDMRPDVSVDGKYACVGAQRGIVSILDLGTGKEVATLRHQKLKSTIAACVFGRDLRHVLCSTKDGFILRYDYVSPREWAEWTKIAKEIREDED